MRNLLWLLAAALVGVQAQTVYRCGEHCYSSRATGKAVQLPPLGHYRLLPETETPPEPHSGSLNAARQPAAPVPSVPAKAVRQPQNSDAPIRQAAPAAAPRVPNAVSRRLILQQELLNEQRALIDAQKSLADTPPQSPQTARLRNIVHEREQNIRALQNELKRL